jgi:hypothetical protein
MFKMRAGKLFCCLLLVVTALFATGCQTLRDFFSNPVAEKKTGVLYDPEHGGSDISMAITQTEGDGLSSGEEFLLGLISDQMTTNIIKYSSINLTDEQHINEIVAHQESTQSGIYSEESELGIGTLRAATYKLLGTLRKDPSTGNFFISLRVTDFITGGVVTDFSPQKSYPLAMLRNTTVLSNATASLLDGLGVILTDEGKNALNAQTELYEAELAADNGNSIASLFYLYSAHDSDASLTEAADRLNQLAAEVASGTGADIVNDIDRRNEWKKRLQEFENLVTNKPPYQIAYTPTPAPKGNPDYDNRTQDWEIQISLVPIRDVSVFQKVLNDMLKGLKKQKNYKNWGFEGWPNVSADSTQSKSIETAIFTRVQPYPVELSMYNENDEKISTVTAQLYGQLFLTGGNKIRYDATQRLKVEFPKVPADKLVGSGRVIVRVERIREKRWQPENENLLKVDMVDAKSMPRIRSATIPKKSQNITFAQKQIIEKPVKPKKPPVEISLKKFHAGINGVYYTSKTIGAGVELGYKTFTIEGTFQQTVGDYNGGDQKDDDTGKITEVKNINRAFGGNMGFSGIWDNAIFTFALGSTAYHYEDSDYIYIPNGQLRLDIIPWKWGPSLRFGYMLEVGNIQMGPQYGSYFINRNASRRDDGYFLGNTFLFGLSFWI